MNPLENAKALKFLLEKHVANLTGKFARDKFHQSKYHQRGIKELSKEVGMNYITILNLIFKDNSRVRTRLA